MLNDLTDHISKKSKFTLIDLLVLHFLSLFPDSEVRCDVAELLCSNYSLWNEVTLIRMTFDRDELVRLNAIDSLCIGKTKLALRRLLRLSYSKNELIRAYCYLSIIDVLNNRNKTYEKRSYFHYIIKRLKMERSDKVLLMVNSSLYVSGVKSCITAIIKVIKKQINTDMKDYFLIMNVIDEILDNSNKNKLKSLIKEIYLKVSDKPYIERLQESEDKLKDMIDSDV